MSVSGFLMGGVYAVALVLIFESTVSLASNQAPVVATQKMANGDSFVYHKCWTLNGDENEIAQSENMEIRPTEKCSSQDQGTWVIGITLNDPAISIEEHVRLQKRSPRFPLFYSGTVLLGGKSATIFEEVVDESDKLIDRKDQTNYFWQVSQSCNRKNFTLSYGDHLDKSGREKVRKEKIIPPVFKAFVEGYRCRAPR